MYFTVIFVDNNEGPSLSYDLAFHPAPIWFQGVNEIGIPDSGPHYQMGSIKFLIDKLGSGFNKSKFNCVKVISHENGIGSVKDYQNLIQDLINEGFKIQL